MSALRPAVTYAAILLAVSTALVLASPGRADAAGSARACTSSAPKLRVLSGHVVRGKIHARAAAPCGLRRARVAVRYTFRSHGKRRTRRWHTTLRSGRIAIRKLLDRRARRGYAARGVLDLRVRRPGAKPLVTRVPLPLVNQPAARRGAQLGLFEDLQYLTGPELDRRLDEYKATGAKWARFQVLWSNVQSGGPDYYYWKPLDDLVSGLLARGIQPLAVVGTTPAWARPAGCQDQPTCAPADPDAFGRFAGAAAARYAGRVRHWEIWNEPNSRIFFKPGPDVSAYTDLLRSSYSHIKSAEPSATVISGGTAPAVTRSDAAGPEWISPVDFMSGIYAHGGGDSFDAVGQHPYTYPAFPDTTSLGSAWYQMFGTPRSIRGLMAAHGDAGKKIWATEFGAHTDPDGQGYVSEAQQARMVTKAARLWGSYSWAGPLVFYSYRDRGTDRRDREDFFGLTRYDGTPKPALRTFEAAARNG